MSKPVVSVEGCEAPEELVIIDEKIGDGDEAKAGDVVDVHYVGVGLSDGKQFDASWDRGKPLRFTLGVGQVIPGWDRGVQGMRVGGRRRLEIPSSLAYGPRGVPGVIKGGETLIFVCDLVGVTGR